MPHSVTPGSARAVDFRCVGVSSPVPRFGLCHAPFRDNLSLSAIHVGRISTMDSTPTTRGTYSDGSAVTIVGERGGFTYITFLDGPNKGITCKVPSSWVTR